MNNLSSIQIDEVSLLSKNSRPAVRGAVVRLAKSGGGASGFQSLIAELVSQGMSHGSAITAASQRDPDGFEAWKNAGHPGFFTKTEGDDAVDFTKARTDYETSIAKIRARDDCSRLHALEKIAMEEPEIVKAYNEAGNPSGAAFQKKQDAAFAKAKEASDTLDHLIEKQRRDGETKAAAYDRVLQERPELYAAYDAARRGIEA